MPRFKGEYSESFVVPKPLTDTMNHFCDPEVIATYHGDVKLWEKVDENTIHYIMIPKSEKGVTFNGEYTVKYDRSEKLFSWKSVGQGNMWVTGKLRFSAEGEQLTRLHFYQEMECEMEVNRFLAKIIKGIVAKEIASGAKKYLQRMRDAL